MGGRNGQGASPTKDGHDRKVEIFHSAANPDGDHDDVGQGTYMENHGAYPYLCDYSVRKPFWK